MTPVSEEMDKLFWIGWVMIFVLYPLGLVGMAWLLCFIINQWS